MDSADKKTFVAMCLAKKTRTGFSSDQAQKLCEAEWLLKIQNDPAAMAFEEQNKGKK